MEMFLFWVFLVGILIALVQDVKRREVDNWLTAFLFVFGLVFVVFRSIYASDMGLLVQGLVAITFGFILMNLFYYGRVFGGGDAKLMSALSVLFVGATYLGTLFNVILFVFLLFISGAAYGLLYIFVVYSIHFNDSNNEFKKRFKFGAYKFWFLSGFVLLIAGFFFDLFYVIAALILFFPFLYVFAKALEDVAMVKSLSGKKLREGDWLAFDEKVGRRVIKSNWEGLSKDEARLLSKKKSVKIKDGIPFLPAFLIAYLLYFFFIDKISWLFGL